MGQTTREPVDEAEVCAADIIEAAMTFVLAMEAEDPDWATAYEWLREAVLGPGDWDRLHG